MKKELEIFGATFPLLGALGIGGLAVGGAFALGYFIIKELNKKGMALSKEDLEAIGKLIDEKLDKKLTEVLKPIHARLNDMATKDDIKDMATKDDIRGLNNRIKGLRDFWIAETVDKFIREKYGCKENKGTIKVLSNVQGYNVEVQGVRLQSLELDRLFWFKCKGRGKKKDKVVILEFTETLTANMFNSAWKGVSVGELYEKEKGIFVTKNNPDNPEKEFKSFSKIYNKLLYKYGRNIEGVSIKEFYKEFARGQLGIKNKAEYLFYYAAMRIENEEIVKELAKKLGVGIVKVSASLGMCDELVSPQAF